MNGGVLVLAEKEGNGIGYFKVYLELKVPFCVANLVNLNGEGTNVGRAVFHVVRTMKGVSNKELSRLSKKGVSIKESPFKIQDKEDFYIWNEKEKDIDVLLMAETDVRIEVIGRNDTVEDRDKDFGNKKDSWTVVMNLFNSTGITTYDEIWVAVIKIFFILLDLAY